MKKLWWMLPVTLLVMGGLLFLGCPDGDDDDDDFYVSLASANDPLTITLNDNFQYGEGYQGQYKKADLMKGKKVTVGDIFWLDVTFKADRDLEDAMWVGLVDTVTGYWNPLTWDGDDKDDEGALFGKADEDGDPIIVEEGVEVSLSLKMVALKTSPNNGADYNVLNIQTKGDGDGYNKETQTEGTAGSGVEGSVDLVFTKFVFARADVWDDSKVPGFIPPDNPDPIVIFEDGDFTSAYEDSSDFDFESGNLVINISPGIDTDGYTTVCIELKATAGYMGGSIEGNGADGSSWVNIQKWGGFSHDGAVFSGPLTGDDGKKVASLKKICANGPLAEEDGEGEPLNDTPEDAIAKIKKIWVE